MKFEFKWVSEEMLENVDGQWGDLRVTGILLAHP